MFYDINKCFNHFTTCNLIRFLGCIGLRIVKETERTIEEHVSKSQLIMIDIAGKQDARKEFHRGEVRVKILSA